MRPHPRPLAIATPATSLLLLTTLMLAPPACDVPYDEDRVSEPDRSAEGAGARRGLPSSSSPAAVLAELYRGHDYVRPAEGLPDGIDSITAALSGEPATPVPDGATVNYDSFCDSAAPGTRPLRQLNGKYTALLVSSGDLANYGVARLRKWVDEHDMIYEALKQVIGTEPRGTGLLPIAFIPDTCGAGYGFLGNKGIEIIPDWYSWPVVAHEMTHNFDRSTGDRMFGTFLYDGPDSPHSWTAIWDQFLRNFTRMGWEQLNPEDYQDRELRYRLRQYENYPGRSWQTCMVNVACDPPSETDQYGLAFDISGSIVNRIAQLHGRAAIAGWTTQARNLITSRGLNDATMSSIDKNDLLAESLSLAVGRNLACYFSWWAWPLSSAATTRMAALPASPYCQDSDGDGYSILKHDCLDTNAAVRPNGTESSNGLDDDCNGTKDDVLLAEAGDFPDDGETPTSITIPKRVTGTIDSPDDRDWFRFTLSATTTLRFSTRSLGGLGGWLIVRDEFAANDVMTHDLNNTFGGEEIEKVTLPAGTWTMFMAYRDATGAYEFVVRADYAFPADADGRPITLTPLAGATNASNPAAFDLPVPPTPPSLGGTPGLLAEFWASAFGPLGSKTAGSSTPFTWIAPADLNPAKVAYRVSFRASGLPVAPQSQEKSLLGPAPWAEQDIGAVSAAGGHERFSEASLTVRGSGSDIGGTADQFHFVYQPWTGDGEVVAQVLSVQNTNSSAKAGVMIRESLAANAKHASMLMKADRGLLHLRRTSAGGSTSTTSSGTAADLSWVKMVRKGSSFASYKASDGVHWTLVSSTSITMGSSVFMGLAVTSRVNGVVNTSNLDRVGVRVTPSALLVANSTTLGSGDAAVKARLENLGYDVPVKSASSAVTADANGKAVVVISASVDSTQVNSKFRNVTVPVLTWESALYDDMGMTSTTSGNFGFSTGQTSVNIALPSHYLAAGRSGTVPVVTTASSFSWGKPNTNADRIATLTSDSTRFAIFGYRKGTAMPGLTAPAKRVAMFFEDTTATSANANGWALFDAAVTWSRLP